MLGPASLITRANDAIDRLAAACAAQPACAATGPFEENLAAAAARLDQQPYSGAAAAHRRRVQSTSGRWRVMSRSDLIPALPAAAAAIAGGDNSILDALAAAFAPSADPHDNFAAGMNEVVHLRRRRRRPHRRRPSRQAPHRASGKTCCSTSPRTSTATPGTSPPSTAGTSNAPR